MPAAHQWDDLLGAARPHPGQPGAGAGCPAEPGLHLRQHRQAQGGHAERGALRLVLREAGGGGLPHRRGSRLLLPAHITERVYIYGGSLFSGATIAFPESLDTFIEDVKRCRPTVFISVPRLWAMFRIKIHEKLPQKKLALLLKIPVSSLIKSKLQKGLGLDQARVLGCGSAPVAPALLEWYHSIGIHITEAWGMTENHAYSTLNYPFRADKIGTVGKAGPGVTIKISDEGRSSVAATA
jgi:long-chain acyl-CoA synthetase